MLIPRLSLKRWANEFRPTGVAACSDQATCIASTILRNPESLARMKRSGSKPGIQRRRSSGLLKLGRLHLRDAPKPTKNAVFSFDADGRGESKSTNLADMAASETRPGTSRLSTESAMPAAQAKNKPIPLPSGHIHRTASEIDLLLDQKQARARERIMFQRIVSGMVNCQRGEQITIITKTNQNYAKKEEGKTKAPGTVLHGNTLSAANDSAQRLLESVAPPTKIEALHLSPTAKNSEELPEVADYFIGSSTDNCEKVLSHRRSTPPSSDIEEIFPLDM